MLSLLSFSQTIKIVLSLIFSLCVFLMLSKYKIDKFKNNKNLFFEQKSVESLLQKLETTPDNEVIEALLKVLKANNINAEIVKKRLESKNSVYLFNFDKETSRTKICYFIRAFCNKKIYLFCNKVSDDCSPLLKNFKHKITIIDAKRVFLLFKNAKLEILNDLEHYNKKTYKLKQFITKTFTKKRAINFTLISGCLLLFSTFTFFPTYYQICSLLSAFIAIVCLIFGNRQNECQENNFVFED